MSFHLEFVDGLLDRDVGVPWSPDAPEGVQEAEMSLNSRLMGHVAANLRPFLKDHLPYPGSLRIRKHHVESFERALSAYREKHPRSVPRRSGALEDVVHAVLLWFAWWARHTWQTFKTPYLRLT